jgi:carboxypeptidase Q
MDRRVALILAGLLGVLPGRVVAQVQKAEPGNPIQREYQRIADRIIAAATADSAAWHKLAELTDRFGHRLSGSEALERAIDWIIERMKAEGLANVRGEPVMVPKWVRGREQAELKLPRVARLPMLGLGGSVATPPDGIEAEVLVARASTSSRSEQPSAKERSCCSTRPTPITATVAYRWSGAIEAAKAGAVASLIRSVAPFGLRTPHTGSMAPYDSTLPKLPAAAITMEDAAMLHRMQARGGKIVVRLEMEAQTLPDVPSRNVMGEILGREKPDEVVVFGGHIDSWDVGTGAMDDAGGVVIAWEAVRLLGKLGLRPRRTIRAVGWTNRERQPRRPGVSRHAPGRACDTSPPSNRTADLQVPRLRLLRRRLGLCHREADRQAAQAAGADTIFAGGGGRHRSNHDTGRTGMSHNVDGTRYFSTITPRPTTWTRSTPGAGRKRCGDGGDGLRWRIYPEGC